MKPAILLCMVRGIDYIAKALLERADVELICLHDCSADELERQGIANRRLNAFITDDVCQRAVASAESRGSAVARALHEADLSANCAAAGPLPAEPVNRHLATVLQRDFPEEILLVDMVRRVACETDLRLIVTPEDICRDTRAIVSAAQRIGVPTLHVLHGYPAGTNHAHDSITADVIAVFSERAKRLYESFGTRPEQVVVTGNPFWDIHSRPPRPDHKEAACAAMGLDPGRPIIEYALTNGTRFSAESVARVNYHLESADVVLQAFTELSRNHPDWQFVLRSHPSEAPQAEQLAARARDAGVDGIHVDLGSAHDAITVVDVLLCTHSNMGIEAILHGKPVINVAIDDILGQLYVEGMGPLFLEDDAVLWARSWDEVGPMVEAALQDEETKDRLLALRPGSIERFNYRNDGNATERMVDLALAMLAHPGKFCQPLTRFPEFEPGLARLVPEAAGQVLVVGRGATHTSDAVCALRPGARVESHAQFAGVNPDRLYDAVVLSEPVAHDGAAETLVCAARRHLAPGALLVMAFQNGRNPEAAVDYAEGRWVPPWPGFESPNEVGQTSWPGVELLMSRCDLQIEAHTALPFSPGASAGPGQHNGIDQARAWIVSARARPREAGEYGRTRAANRAAAEELNEAGETRFAEGDAVGALGLFAKAARTWAHDARIYNNLAVALHAVGKVDEAWRRVVEALSIDPSFQAARDNLRLLGAEIGREDESNRILDLFGEETNEG
ncbi:MAG: hypothetical protein GY851_18525 [bacterium]|nr:hypothetical protein [bacterium]